MARKNKPIQAPAVAADVVGVQEENQRFEAPSLDIRGRGKGVSTIEGYLFRFKVTKLFSFLLERVGHRGGEGTNVVVK